MRRLPIILCSLWVALGAAAASQPVDLVSTLVGTLSKHSLSTGNTYPAIAMPWGMNFWTPQTGKMGDGWQYVYTADKIRGLKQTHQPSPWINDYGQFAIMATTGRPVFDEDKRASWFSHKAETATATEASSSGQAADLPPYIGQMTFNGQPYDRNYLEHADLMKGGWLFFCLQSQPNRQRGTSAEAAPYSFSKEIN